MAREAGRDPSSIGVVGAVTQAGRAPEALVQEALAWQRVGATHLTFRTVDSGHADVEAHLEALRRFKRAWESR